MPNIHFRKPTTILLSVIFMCFGTVFTSYGLGTVSGTSITNQATVNFTVGANPQVAVQNTPPTSFLVDNKVDLNVTRNSPASVTVNPNTTAQVIQFTVRNDGNTVQDYDLVAVALAGGLGASGGTDNFDATNVDIFLEDGSNAGYQPLEDTATFIDELAADGTQIIYLVGDIPALLLVAGVLW